MSSRLFAFFIACGILLVCGLVVAQERDPCSLEKRTFDSVRAGEKDLSVQRVMDLVSGHVKQAVKKNGIENARKVRNTLYDKYGNNPPTSDFDSLALFKWIHYQMELEYCELIWSRSGWSSEEKQASLNRVSQALGGDLGWGPVEPSEEQAFHAVPQLPAGQLRNDGQGGFIRHISFEPSLSRMVAQNEPRFLLAADDAIDIEPVRSVQPLVPEGRSVYLRDPPPYVTNCNNFFVIVASPTTKE